MLLTCNYNSMKAQTTISGGNASGTWEVEGSPYLIAGSIMVPNDSTLMIESGVTINFQGSYKLYIQGRIIALGEINDSINFTTTDSLVGWLGIRFDNTPTTNDTSKFRYCKFQFGKALYDTAENKGGAFYLNDFSKVIISNCLITILLE